MGHGYLRRAGKTGFVLTYDDVLSINYFGQWRRSYWTKAYQSIQDAIAAVFGDKNEVLPKASAFDARLEAKVEAIGGADYVFLCSMAYHQTVTAHKLITEGEENVIFLSKGKTPTAVSARWM